MKKIVKFVIVFCVLCILSGCSKKFDNGWTSDGKYYENGNLVINSWRDYNGSYRYLGADGKVVYNQWVDNNDGTWSYTNSSGNCVISDTISIEGSLYSFDNNGYLIVNDDVIWKEGWYYAESDGKLTFKGNKSNYKPKVQGNNNGGSNNSNSSQNVYERVATYTASKDEAYNALLETYKGMFQSGANYMTSYTFAPKLADMATDKYMIYKCKKNGQDFTQYSDLFQRHMQVLMYTYNPVINTVNTIAQYNRSLYQADLDNANTINRIYNSLKEDYYNAIR